MLLGRTKPVPPKLDVLFAVPAAALTVQAGLGYAPTGAGAVCFKSAEGEVAEQAERDIRALLALDAGSEVTVRSDEYGFTWVTCRRDDADLTTLMTQLHGVNRTLDDAGFGPSLLCTVVGFERREDNGPRHRLGLVYLFKRGTVYPFAPTGGQHRDTTLELRVRAELTAELPVEPDLKRWFPIWDAPVP